MKLLARLGALALGLISCAALAADPNVGLPALAPSKFGPAAAIYCPDTNGNLAACSFGSGGGGATTIADGSDTAEGAKADTAYAGSGAASEISLLKGVYAGLLAATPAGGNNIGSLTNITGTISLPTGAATATNQTTGNGSLSTLAGTVGAVGSPATTAQTVQGTVATTVNNGANLTEGNTGDTAYSGTGSATVISLLKGTYAKLPTAPGQQTTAGSLSVTLPSDAGPIFWTEQNAASVGASATLSGSARSCGGAAGGTSAAKYGLFAAEFYSDQSGNIYVDKSFDGGTTWLQATMANLTGASGKVIVERVQAATYRARFVNGSTASTGTTITTSCTNI